MSKPKILVTCGHLQRHIGKYNDEIISHGFEAWVPPLNKQQFSESEMLDMLPQADMAIAGDDPLGAAILKAGVAGKLKGLVRWGIGTDNVDKPVATALGLPVYNTPGMFSNEVADLALGHLLNLARKIHLMDRDVRAGKWTRYEGMSLTGKTAGIVGLGGIGRETARRMHVCGMKVLGSDVAILPADLLAAHNVEQVSFERVLKESDVVILACNLTEENHHLMNEQAFAAMKRGAIFINVARGPIVKEAALVHALESGHIAAAGLDVFEEEPMVLDNPLRKFENCLFGTHSGSSTAEAIQRTNRKSIDIAFAMMGINPGLLENCNRVA
jgi:D-3-phosphoglycerate dehydrogenase / 2-oxoglutarate reductase